MPQTCNTAVATRQIGVMVTHLDHEGIMEEAIRCNVLEYNGNKEEEESGNKDRAIARTNSTKKKKSYLKNYLRVGGK